MRFIYGFGGVEFLMILSMLSMGGAPVPLSMPPLPEDPVIGQIAPEKCMVYFSMAGAGKADPASKNPTERIMAEPEVQRMLAQLGKLVSTQFQRNLDDDDSGPEAEFLRAFPKLAEFALTHPSSLYLTAPEKAASRGYPMLADFKGGFVLALGDDAAAFKAVLDKLLAGLPEKMITKRKIKDETFLRIASPEKAEAVVFDIGYHANCFIMAIGDGEAEAIVARFGGTPPQWLRTIRAQLPVPRVASTTYVDIQAVIEMIRSWNPEEKESPKVIKTLGLDKMKTLTSVSGLDDNGCVHRTHLGIEGDPSGILKLLGGRPLKAADLAGIPADSEIALALRFDLATGYDVIKEIMDVDPFAAREFKGAVDRFEEVTGVKLQDELLKALGDTWSVYNSPSEGGLVFTGLTGAISVRDHAKLAVTHDKLLALLKTQLERDAKREAGPTKDSIKEGAKSPYPPMKDGPAKTGETTKPSAEPAKEKLYADSDESPYSAKKFGYRRSVPTLKQMKVGKHTIHYLTGGELHFATPAWCLTETELIVAAFPQNVVAYLSRKPGGKSLADLPEVAELLSQRQPPLMITHGDSRQLFQYAYPMLQMALSAGMSYDRSQDVFQFGDIASGYSVGRHIQPGVSYVRQDMFGFEMVTHNTLPSAGIGSLLPLTFSISAVGEVSRSAMADQRNSEYNLRNLTRAMERHLDEKGKLPAAYSVGKDGKPLLSWRVHLLPQMGRSDLYERFKLDEPWDSEHNKSLIAEIPYEYSSRGYSATKLDKAEGKTRYVLPRGSTTAFPGAEGVAEAEIRDGFDTTIALIFVPESAAVVWTKPEDLDTEMGIARDLVLAATRKKVRAVTLDGEVVRVDFETNKKDLNAMLTRAGGETVEVKQFVAKDPYSYYGKVDVARSKRKATKAAVPKM